MKYTKWFAGLALAVGMGLTGAPALSAQPYARDAYQYRQDYRSDREVSRDRARIERLRVEIAQDRMRLNEDIRRGRNFAARRDAEELARDQRRLNELLRVVRYDRYDTSWNRR